MLGETCSADRTSGFRFTATPNRERSHMRTSCHRPIGFAAVIAAGLVVSITPSTSIEAHAQSRPTTPAAAPDPGLARLEAEMTRLATIAGGKVGVAAVHLETGREVVLNRGEPFPMASTFKVPVAVQLLSRVDSGKVRLDSMITVRQSDLHPGSGTMTRLLDDPGVTLSVRHLL